MNKPTINVSEVLDALDAGKSQNAIAAWMGINIASVNAYAQMRNAIISKDHKIVAEYVYGKHKRLTSADGKKEVMKRYDYFIPEEFLPKDDVQTITPIKTDTQKLDTILQAINVVAKEAGDKAVFNSLLTQAGTTNAMLTALEPMGSLLHNISECLAGHSASTSRDMDRLIERIEVTNENLNALIQQMSRTNDLLKNMRK